MQDDAGAVSNVAAASLIVEAVVPSAPIATLIEVTLSSAMTGLTVTYNGKVGFKDADHFAIASTPYMVGNWTLEAYVEDASGTESTTLTGTLAVTAPPSTVPASTCSSKSTSPPAAGSSCRRATPIPSGHRAPLAS